MNDEIRQYLVELRGSDGLADLADDASLLLAGAIDSVAMIDLIAHLESRYGIRIDEDDMTPENFDSIEAISSYIGRKRGGSRSR